MKMSKHTEQQIAFILKQADDGVSIEDTCRKVGTPNHWLQHAAANEREAEFSRSKWSNEGARHSGFATTWLIE